MIYRQQLDMTDCGAACLSMIASHYGKHLNLAEVRGVSGTDLVGTNVQGLVKAAHSFGLSARPVKGTIESFDIKTPVPFIAHVHIERSPEEWIDHFVVVKKIGKKKIEIWNPDPMEKKKQVSLEYFNSIWTGYAIFLKPGDCFTADTKKENLLLKFFPVFLPHTKVLVYSFLASLVLIFFGIVSSFYYKYVFDEIIFAKASISLTTLSIAILSLTIIQSVVSLIRGILLSHFSYKTDLQLHFSYLAHIFKLPLSFFESRKSGEILSRLGDLAKVKQTLSDSVLSGIMDVIMLAISGPILWKINGTLFSVSFITVLLVSVIVFIFSHIYRRYYSKIMSENAEVYSYLVESLNGVATVKALNAESLVYSEYEKRKMQSVATNWKVNRYNLFQALVTGIINGASALLVFWLGSKFIIGDVITFGTLLTFNSLLGYFTGPLFRLVNMQTDLQEALVAAERVGEILELEREQADSAPLLAPDSIDGHIALHDITFRYGSRKPIYEHLSLEIVPGSWTAFVGPSGCGKTTLTKLLLKFYLPEEGQILIDGNDIRDIDAQFLRSKIGYVPQDVFLFSGTVMENIVLHHPEASLEEAMQAAKKSGAHEFIEKLPKRYHTVLGEHGGGLSGGERQKLALARALVGNPSFIILDEATSNLDTMSEKAIHEIIQGLRSENLTVILIAHRLSTIMSCDTIFVMENGKIVQNGTHQELCCKDGLYQKMWKGMTL